MAIDSNSASVIDLGEAKEFVSNFKAKYPDLPKAFFVGSDKLELILSQSGCMGVRIYNGFDEEKSMTNLVLVGVDKNEKDMTDGIILERLVPCPSACDLSSALY